MQNEKNQNREIRCADHRKALNGHFNPELRQVHRQGKENWLSAYLGTTINHTKTFLKNR